MKLIYYIIICITTNTSDESRLSRCKIIYTQLDVLVAFLDKHVTNAGNRRPTHEKRSDNITVT